MIRFRTRIGPTSSGAASRGYGVPAAPLSPSPPSRSDHRLGRVSAEQARVGWIGTGVMGAAMCGHLLAAGYPVTVFNRTRERAQALLDAGAGWASSPAEVAAASDVVFTIVGFPSDVREVVLGDDGVLAGARPGSVLVDMTTSEPSLAREIAEAARAKQVDALDAPVSGGDVGARNATLVIMVGGSEAAFERVRPLLEKLGQTIVLEGGPGAGQHTKMVNQIAIASGMIGVCEALLYAYRAGLDVEPRARDDLRRRRGLVVADELRAAHPPRRLRPRLQGRPLRQGPRDRARRGRADEARAAGARARAPALRRGAGAGPRPARHARARQGAREPERRRRELGAR